MERDTKVRAARVLLVDDRRDNLLALSAVLEPLDFELVTAVSGPEALRCLLEQEVAAIVLDVQMPDMDGFETAALLKSRAATRHIPIVLLTAISHDLAHQLRGYEAGAVDYISKPFEPNVLRAKVRALVEMAEELRGAREEPPRDEPALRPSSQSAAAAKLSTAASWEVAESHVAEVVSAEFQKLVRVLDLTIESGVEAPGIARGAVRGVLDGYPEALRDTLVLLVSELVTNSTTHARSAAELHLDIGGSLLRLEVADRDLRPPDPRLSTPNDDDGRGLQIVRRLADRCGYTRLGASKVSWLELDLGHPE